MQRGNAFMLTNATTSCKVRLARKKLTNDSSSKKEHVERQGPSGQRSRPGGPTFMFLKLLTMISGWFNCCYWPDFFFFKGGGGHLCTEVTISKSNATTDVNKMWVSIVVPPVYILANIYPDGDGQQCLLLS